uniref:Uncharacterized protein n=1 Tax=Tanacetum cinerariifolium TaxID=118510 RepID=A0A699KK76_TANCI|nr:hypothetical protein [Tanacetum cinerariifolium]
MRLNPIHRIDLYLYGVLTSDLHMAYPFMNTSYLLLEEKGLEYSDEDIADFKERLERIHDKDTHRVQVLYFEDMSELMRDVLYARMLMEHRDDVRRIQETYELEGVHLSSGITYRGGDRVLRSMLSSETLGLGAARQEGNAEGVAKEALVAPGGGDEDEEMPRAVPPPSKTQGERIS